MARALVIGSTGMLGWLLVRVLREAGHEVLAWNRGDAGFDAARGIEGLPADVDVAVNCVAVTRAPGPSSRQLGDLVAVNGVFPHRLAEFAELSGFRLIHISSDGVFRGSTVPLFEDDEPTAVDVYGASKRLGEPASPAALSIRCSILGPERAPRGHLMSWFLGQPDGRSVAGYSDQIWNGVTTLQLARFCEQLLSTTLWTELRKRTPVVHYSPNEPLSKADLLIEMARIYQRDIRVEPRPSGVPFSRVLASRHDDLLGLGERRPFREALLDIRSSSLGEN